MNKLKTAIGSVVIASSMAVASTTAAQNIPPDCDPEILRSLVQASIANQQMEAQMYDNLARTLLESPIGEEFSGCIQLRWPSGFFQIPSIQSILQNIKERVIREGCRMAQDKVSGLTSIYNQSAFVDLGVPGVPSVGFSFSGRPGRPSLRVNDSDVPLPPPPTFRRLPAKSTMTTNPQPASAQAFQPSVVKQPPTPARGEVGFSDIMNYFSPRVPPKTQPQSSKDGDGQQ